MNDPEDDAIVLVLEYMSLGQVMTYHNATHTFSYLDTTAPMDEETVRNARLLSYKLTEYTYNEHSFP
jgi:hypothetical protein